ncbi:MAG TPA: hypothetical protein VGP38_01435 [Rubrobacter sp.]|nr:hypothetical protein [Rubrobacter sp.]
MSREARTFTPTEIGQLERMAGLGMPTDQIAAVLGTSKKTLERRVKDQPGVNDALLRGRAKISAAVRQTLFTMATSGKCVAATIFWLKVREGWKEERDDAKPVEPRKVELGYAKGKKGVAA